MNLKWERLFWRKAKSNSIVLTEACCGDGLLTNGMDKGSITYSSFHNCLRLIPRDEIFMALPRSITDM